MEARYEPIAFSDHMAYIVSFSSPKLTASMISHRSRPVFKIRPEVICEKELQERLADSMQDWKEVRDLGLEYSSGGNFLSNLELKNWQCKEAKS